MNHSASMFAVLCMMLGICPNFRRAIMRLRSEYSDETPLAVRVSDLN